MPPVRRYRSLLVCALLLVTALVAVPSPASASQFFQGPLVRSADAEAELLQTMNQLRTEVYGLPALESKSWGGFESYLNCVAADNQARVGLAHYPAGCGQGFVEAEILAANYHSLFGGSTNQLVDQWNHSDGHRRIMLADADYVRVGVFCMGRTAWAVAWVGSDVGHAGTREVATRDPADKTGFFNGNDYNCDASGSTLPTGNPAQASGGGGSTPTTLDELVSRPGFSAANANVLRLYRAFFNRQPDIAGANYWVDLNNRGLGQEAIANQFALSQEFRNSYGSVNNAQFIAIVYQNVLGRAYDQAGFDYWLGLVESGQLTRAGAVRWIAESQEFRNANPFGGL